MSGVKKQLQSLVSDLLDGIRSDTSQDAWAWASSEDFSFFRSLAQSTPLQKSAQPSLSPAPQAACAPAPPPVRRRPVARKLPPKQAAMEPQKTEAPQEVKDSTKDVSSAKEWMALQPVDAPLFTSWHEASQLLKGVKDRLNLVEALPTDVAATGLSHRWRRQLSTDSVFIYHSKLPPSERLLLSNIAQAIDLYLAPCIISDTLPDGLLDPKGPQCVRLFLCSETCLKHDKALLDKIQSDENKSIGKNPVLVLAPLNNYLDHPALKAPLWESLCHLLSGKK